MKSCTHSLFLSIAPARTHKRTHARAHTQPPPVLSLSAAPVRQCHQSPKPAQSYNPQRPPAPAAEAHPRYLPQRGACPCILCIDKTRYTWHASWYARMCVKYGGTRAITPACASLPRSRKLCVRRNTHRLRTWYEENTYYTRTYVHSPVRTHARTYACEDIWVFWHPQKRKGTML